jgi:hypothetical protein
MGRTDSPGVWGGWGGGGVLVRMRKVNNRVKSIY